MTEPALAPVRATVRASDREPVTALPRAKSLRALRRLHRHSRPPTPLRTGPTKRLASGVRPLPARLVGCVAFLRAVGAAWRYLSALSGGGKIYAPVRHRVCRTRGMSYKLFGTTRRTWHGCWVYVAEYKLPAPRGTVVSTRARRVSPRPSCGRARRAVTWVKHRAPLTRRLPSTPAPFGRREGPPWIADSFSAPPAVRPGLPPAVAVAGRTRRWARCTAAARAPGRATRR